MRSVDGLSLPLVPETRTWFRAFTTGKKGQILHVTPRRSRLSGSAFTRTRFNPGDHHGVGTGFETLYLALDPTTALFEKQAQFGDPFGGFVIIAPRMDDTDTLPVSVHLDAVLDLSDVNVHAMLETNAQERTGDWNGYQQRERGVSLPLGVLTAPTGLAPTQQLSWELHQDPRVKGIIGISAKVPTTCCLGVFTHKLRSPDQLSWDDPNTGRRETYP